MSEEKKIIFQINISDADLCEHQATFSPVVTFLLKTDSKPEFNYEKIYSEEPTTDFKSLYKLLSCLHEEGFRVSKESSIYEDGSNAIITLILTRNVQNTHADNQSKKIYSLFLLGFKEHALFSEEKTGSMLITLTDLTVTKINFEPNSFQEEAIKYHQQN